MRATIVIVNADNAALRPTLWRSSKILFHVPPKRLRITVGGEHVAGSVFSSCIEQPQP